MAEILYYVVGVLQKEKKKKIYIDHRQQQKDEKHERVKETKLIIVVGLLAVAVIALVVTLTLQIAVFGKQEYKEMCQSEECIRTGEKMLNKFLFRTTFQSGLKFSCCYPSIQVSRIKNFWHLQFFVVKK